MRLDGLAGVAIAALLCASAPANAEQVNVESLLSILKQHNPQTIAAALGRIDQAHPGFLKGQGPHRTSYIYRSESPQLGSTSHPKIVVGHPEQLMLAFNGSPAHPGYDGLEIFAYENGRYIFREIVFKKDQKTMKDGDRNYHYSKHPSDIDFENEFYTVSIENPAKCMQCHGAETPRIVWNPYFIWPGIYGSNQDKSVFEKHFSNNGSQKEKNDWTAFRTSHARHERYKLLEVKENTFDNLDITAGFSRSNALRIVQEIKTDPDLAPFQYLFSALAFSNHYPYHYLTDKTAGYDLLRKFIPANVMQTLGMTPEKVWAYQHEFYSQKIEFFGEILALFQKDFATAIRLTVDVPYAQYGRTPLYRMFRDEKDPGRKYGIFRLRSYEPRFDLAYAMYRFLNKDFNWSMTMSPKGLHFNDGTFFNSFYRGFQTLTGCTYTERSDQMNESPDCNVESGEIQRKSREFITEGKPWHAK